MNEFKTLGEILDRQTDGEFLREVLANNVWSYEPQNYLLSYDGYNVHLNRMAHADAVLDWIVHVSEKSWATSRVIADLVRALDAILELRVNYCVRDESERGCRVNPLPIPAEPQS